MVSVLQGVGVKSSGLDEVDSCMVGKAGLLNRNYIPSSYAEVLG
jgi:hypothetical protein